MYTKKTKLFIDHAVVHVAAIEIIAHDPEVIHVHRHQSALIRVQDVQEVHDIMTHVFQNPRDAMIHVARVQDLNQWVHVQNRVVRVVTIHAHEMETIKLFNVHF